LSGPVLELGCGTGEASIGLCRDKDIPWFLITDSSKDFINIVKRKMVRQAVDLTRVRFAVLADTDLNQLPPQSVSAIVLRSVLHHFLDVPTWIRAAAPALRPGGAIVCEEPFASGYLIMGIIAQAVAESGVGGLSPEQRNKAQIMADTMKSYNRRDIDKSAWEDKHVFRPEELFIWAQSAGLNFSFIANTGFAQIGLSEEELPRNTDFVVFFKEYLQYCMNFGIEDAAKIAEAAEPLCRYVVEACSGGREPHLMGLLILQKPYGAEDKAA
jgi:2-polyprenyl-3-methyl-5-hydroxy-6-metoxy-1,4-benzoquinol methylase